jgi:hypothetical protein
MLIFKAWLIFMLTVSAVWSADVEAPGPNAPVKPEPAKAPTVGSVPEEEKWIFEPISNRVDVFADMETRLHLEVAGVAAQSTVPGSSVEAPTNQSKIDELIEWGAKEADRVEGLILVRKWDETIAACDNAVKTLEKYQSNAPVADLIERFKRYSTQAVEAKIYEEAQAKFDALGLKIEGILWSPEGSLAVVGGEPRALKINDRAKDCVIINIDTNRVDFLFHYNRRRFEFQRYVGEVANASRAH